MLKGKTPYELDRRVKEVIKWQRVENGMVIASPAKNFPFYNKILEIIPIFETNVEGWVRPNSKCPEIFEIQDASTQWIRTCIEFT